MPGPDIQRWGVGDILNQIVGPDIASAATIAPTHKIHRITGAAAVVNITPPWTGFAGDLLLIAVGAFTWTNAGNISLASAVAAVPGRSYQFVYSPVTALWYPQGITS